MSLTALQLASQVNWNQAGTATGPFSAPTESSSLSFNLGSLNLTTWNQVYANQLTVASGGSTSVDLTSVSNLLGESFSFAHVLAICLSVSGANMSFGPAGVTNGLQWFMNSTSAVVNVDAGGWFMWSDPNTATGTVVNATNKVLKFSNLGSATGGVSVVIVGSTA